MATSPPFILSDEEVKIYKEAIREMSTTTSEKYTAEGRPTPIPLRTLTTLLNYERCASHPRFRSAVLMNTSFATRRLYLQSSQMLEQMKELPASVNFNNIHFHVFESRSDITLDTPSATDPICPSSDENIKSLTREQKETIYYEARSHDGCFKSAGLFQAFFDLCPKNQQVAIQIGKEAPVLVNPFARKIIEYKMKGPKSYIVSSGITLENPVMKTIMNGNKQESPHAVLAFYGPGTDMKTPDYIVDMSRMQYGDIGRGIYGEPYYLGSPSKYNDGISKAFEGMEYVKESARIGPAVGLENTEHMKACAARVWAKWQNRDNEGWCAYCGVGNTIAYPLQKCGGCKIRKVWYCCKEHQVSDRKLHKMTCEKVKK